MRLDSLVEKSVLDKLAIEHAALLRVPIEILVELEG